MLTAKRVIIATIVGFLCGIVCMLMASSNPESIAPLSGIIKISIVLSRTLLGFMIGISALRMAWWLHGIVLGFIGSIPMAMPIVTDNWYIAMGTLFMGIIYGFVIEVITTLLFKAKSVGRL